MYQPSYAITVMMDYYLNVAQLRVRTLDRLCCRKNGVSFGAGGL